VPDGPLAKFPSYLLRKGVILFRAHPVEVGPIWYSSSDIGFLTLPRPFGTLHLTTDLETSVVQLLGPAAGPHRSVTDRQTLLFQVTSFTAVRSMRLANLSRDAAADFGLTALDLSRLDAPAATRRWAESFHRAGFKGVTYRSRYDTGPKNTGISLFGGAGVPVQAGVKVSLDASISGPDAARAAGFHVVPHQTRTHLNLI
jgi:hypothetical protein